MLAQIVRWFHQLTPLLAECIHLIVVVGLTGRQRLLLEGIEGTLALTGQYFLTDYMERFSILPGWVEGFKLISRDEHRHVAYGTWFLREKARDEALRARASPRASRS